MNEIHVGNNLDFATLQSRVIDDIVQLLSRSSCIEVQLKTSTASNCWNSELIVLRELDEVKIGRLLAEHEMKIFAEISATHHSHFITYRFLSAGKHRKVECIKCHKSMQYNHLSRHMETCNMDGSFCYICQTTFLDFTEAELLSHISKCGIVDYTCAQCKRSFKTGRARSRHHCQPPVDPHQSAQCALNGLFKMIEIVPTSSWDFERVFDQEKQHIINILTLQLEYLKAFKFFISAKLGMQRLVHDESSSLIHFRTSSSVIVQSTNVEEAVTDHINMLKHKVGEFLRCGSGFIVNTVDVIHLNLTKYRPLNAGQWLPLPRALQKTSGLLNIKCFDSKCFLWNCLAVSHPYPYQTGSDSEVDYYQQYEHEIDQTGITWPMSLDQITRFEKMNSIYRVNVIAWEPGEGFYPIHVSESNNDVGVIMLMLTGGSRRHFVLVQDLNKLLGCKNKHYFCIRCFHGFLSQYQLKEHELVCRDFKFQVLQFPEEDYLYFKSYRKTVYMPCYIVLDLECILPVVTPTQSRTAIIQDHVVCGFAYKIVTDYEGFKKHVQVYRGPDAAEQLVLRLYEEYEFLKDLLFANEPMLPLTDDEMLQFNNAEQCYMCGLEFEATDQKVADHCHYEVIVNFNCIYFTR